MPPLDEIIYSIGLLFCLAILFLNGLILVRVIRLRNIQHSLLINLTLCDLLIGVNFFVPTLINLVSCLAKRVDNSELYMRFYTLLDEYDKRITLSIYWPLVTAMMASILSLTSIATKKYLQIMKPFSYVRLSRRRHLKIFCWLNISAIWTISILVCVVPYFLFNERRMSNLNLILKPKYSHMHVMLCMYCRMLRLDYIINFTWISIVCSVVILALYTRIYVFAEKEYKAIQHQRSVASIKTCTLDNCSRVDTIQGEEFRKAILAFRMMDDSSDVSADDLDLVHVKFQPVSSTTPVVNKAPSNRKIEPVLYHRQDIQRNTKALRTIVFLLAGFYACWLPVLFYFVYYACEIEYDDLKVYSLLLLTSCNSIINPIVHVLCDKEMLTYRESKSKSMEMSNLSRGC